MLKMLVGILVGLGASGCSLMSALDFGGNDKVSWEIHGGWEHGVHDSTAKPGQVDKDGVYKPETPEAEAILGAPNIHAGIFGEIYPKGHVTPTVQVEVFRFKVPQLRWWEVQVGAGANMVDLFLGKRLVSVFEVTIGPWVGWDFIDSHKRGPNAFEKLAYGIGFTLIKF